VFGGEQWRPLVHVEDAAEAYIRVLNAGINDMKGKVYNVGAEEQNYKIKDVAKLTIESIQGISTHEVTLNVEMSNADVRDYRVSFKRIQNELGFKVQHNIREAARDIYGKLVSGEIKDPKRKVYYNHYFDSSEELVG
jgi:nucleoside-diphosphate-sugar epimerase